MLEKLKNWRGNLDGLIEQAEKVSSGFQLKDTTEISVRMVRDYIQRGILGDISRGISRRKSEGISGGNSED